MASSGGGGLLWLGLLLWFSLFAAAYVPMARARNEYLRLMREIRGVHLVPQEDILRRAYRQPWRWPAESMRYSVRGLTAVVRREDDPTLERARRQFIHRYLLLAAAVFGGWVLPVALSFVTP